jgi:integrase
MPVIKEFDFFKLYGKFMNESRRGRRLQPNGKRVSSGTVNNYYYTCQLVKKFCTEKGISLRIRPTRRLRAQEIEKEKKIWKKFYKDFTNFLYDDCNYFDNYVGVTIKNIRTFFNYLNKELNLGIGDFHKSFYVRKEEIAIFPLAPEELNFLIYDKSFENSLSPRMKEVKDFFVFGCTVALRFSDLIALEKSNIRIINNHYYLSVRSVKTKTDSQVKLPPYAVDIIRRYEKQKRKLLPRFNLVNMNIYIKSLLELAGFIQPVLVTREKRGVPVEQTKDGKYAIRFCDAATTHTMRRTAITTMLSLGVPEQVVRKVSGHSPSGKEFYRYVAWAQAYQDQETEKMFDKLQQKKIIRTGEMLLEV